MLSQKQKAILFIICSAFCFAIMNACVRLAGDLPSIQKGFFRNVVAMIFAGIVLLRKKEPIKIGSDSWMPLILRAVFGTVGILCNFYAIDHLVLSDASILNKMSPFFAIVFSFFILKEKLTSFQILTTIGAFIGILFVIKPTFTNMSLFPSLIGFTGGMAAGMAYTMVRILGQRGCTGSVVVLFFSLFSCLFTLPWMLFYFTPMTAAQWAALLGAGLAAAGGQFTITAAYFHAPAREISIFDYTQIIFAGLLGFVLFGQLPDAWSVLGYVIICTMALLAFFKTE